MKIVSRFDGHTLVDAVEYREVHGFPGYRVGNDGTVWSCRNNRWGIGKTWKPLKPWAIPQGHLYVTLYSWHGKRVVVRYVHRLVLESFIGPCPDGIEACHYPDRTPSNCRVGNLRWDTHLSNMHDSVLHGRTQRGSRHVLSRLTEDSVRAIRQLLGTMSMTELGARYGVSRGAIAHIRRGSTWAWLTQQ